MPKGIWPRCRKPQKSKPAWKGQPSGFDPCAVLLVVLGGSGHVAKVKVSVLVAPVLVGGKDLAAKPRQLPDGHQGGEKCKGLGSRCAQCGQGGEGWSFAYGGRACRGRKPTGRPRHGRILPQPGRGATKPDKIVGFLPYRRFREYGAGVSLSMLPPPRVAVVADRWARQTGGHGSAGSFQFSQQDVPHGLAVGGRATEHPVDEFFTIGLRPVLETAPQMFWDLYGRGKRKRLHGVRPPGSGVVRLELNAEAREHFRVGVMTAKQ